MAPLYNPDLKPAWPVVDVSAMGAHGLSTSNDVEANADPPQKIHSRMSCTASSAGVRWVGPSSTVVVFAVQRRIAAGWTRTIPRASECGSQHGAGSGVFDFTNPTSTLRFSQLILELSPHLAFATEPFFQNNKLDWRSDNAEISSGNFRSWRDRVAQSWEKFPFSPPATPSPSPPARGFTGLSARSSPRTESAATVAWVLDRAILLATRIPFEVSKASPGDEAIEFSDRLLSYDEMCGQVWPSSWDAESFHVDNSLSRLKSLLFQQAGENQLPKNSVLTLEHQQRLQERLSAILYASSGSFTSYMVGRGIKVEERDSRYDWDALLYHFYVQSGEDVSPYVLLEQTIHFARNELVDQPDPQTLVTVHWKQLRRNRSFCSHAFDAAHALHPHSLLSQRALIASTEANNLLIKLSPMLNSPDEVKKLVEHRSRQEPRDGKCDALLFGVIDGQSFDGAEFLISPHSTVPPHQISQSGGFNESLWQNAFHVRVAERAAALAAESGPAYPFAGHLLLPHFVAKYQKLSHDEGQALIQGRMYLASLVAFYSALGIDDYPFYGLVACGKVGSLLMAWKSSTHKQTYLVEHNVCKFDITVPIEAFQFATFLLRLRDDQQRLKKRVEERLKKGVDRERL
ncbi:hypothetical protein B0H10DRAFT_1962594, partial [Mycena sp. CBHHK59/15]